MWESTYIAKKFLEDNLPKTLPKEFFNARCGYEKHFCEVTGAKLTTEDGDKRYWDCETTCGIKIELKKSSGQWWLDKIRYCEMLLAKRGIRYKHRFFDQARAPTVTVFFSTKRNSKLKRTQLRRIYIVDTDKLIEHLDLEYRVSRPYDLIDDYHYSGGKCNYQYGITTKELESIKTFVLNFEDAKSTSTKSPVKKKKTTPKPPPKSKPTNSDLNPTLKIIYATALSICDDNGSFNRKAMIDQIPSIKEANPTILNGKTPANTVSYYLQQLRKSGYIEFISRGVYRIQE